MDFQTLYIVVKTIHILSSTILFGTGVGIAFFMFRSHFTDDLQQKYFAATNTVLADSLFTFPAVVIQPLSGVALIYLVGYRWDEPWLSLTYLIYILAGACWVPVVWIQIQLKAMIAKSIERGDAKLPDRHHRLFRIWFLLGWPAFLGLIAVFYLMVAKPT